MINTVDQDGTPRTLSLTNWNLLPVNPDGTKGNKHLRQTVDTLEVDRVGDEIKAFIESKRCKNDASKECDNSCVETIILDETNTIELALETASIEVQSEPKLAIQKPKQTRKRK